MDTSLEDVVVRSLSWWHHQGSFWFERIVYFLGRDHFTIHPPCWPRSTVWFQIALPNKKLVAITSQPFFSLEQHTQPTYQAVFVISALQIQGSTPLLVSQSTHVSPKKSCNWSIFHNEVHVRRPSKTKSFCHFIFLKPKPETWKIPKSIWPPFSIKVAKSSKISG